MVRTSLSNELGRGSRGRDDSPKAASSRIRSPDTPPCGLRPHPTPAGATIPDSLENDGSRLRKQTEWLELLTEDDLGVSAHPCVERRRIDLAEIDLVLNVPVG